MDIEKYDRSFQKVVEIVENAKQHAFQKVNEELITMYWQVGEYVSQQVSRASYGDSFVANLADYISKNYPDIKGFNRRGLYRMR